VILAVLFAVSAQHAIAGAANSRIRAALAVESLEPKPGSTVRVAIRMTPEPGWHGYWQNPGDSGLPVTVRWEAPAGTRFSELQHPAPRLLSVQGIASYVHEGPFALVARMRVPAGLAPGTRLPLIAHVSWLACSDNLPNSASGAVHPICKGKK
jgi:DsbC/DsbD-like thiol-disulfide interchange protein